MDAQGNELDPDLVQLIAAHCGRSVDHLYPHTHPVFDLGIDGEDVTELVQGIERRFGFAATDAEWRSVSSLADIDRLVKRLRGQQRPEVVVEREHNAKVIARRNRAVIAALVAWLGLGVVSYFVHRPAHMVWVVVTVCALLVHGSRMTLSAFRARRQWKRERRARYGV
jgi:acyl carrier protein